MQFRHWPNVKDHFSRIGLLHLLCSHDCSSIVVVLISIKVWSNLQLLLLSPLHGKLSAIRYLLGILISINSRELKSLKTDCNFAVKWPQIVVWNSYDALLGLQPQGRNKK